MLTRTNTHSHPRSYSTRALYHTHTPTRAEIKNSHFFINYNSRDGGSPHTAANGECSVSHVFLFYLASWINAVVIICMLIGINASYYHCLKEACKNNDLSMKSSPNRQTQSSLMQSGGSWVRPKHLNRPLVVGGPAGYKPFTR